MTPSRFVSIKPSRSTLSTVALSASFDELRSSKVPPSASAQTAKLSVIRCTVLTERRITFLLLDFETLNPPNKIFVLLAASGLLHVVAPLPATFGRLGD